MEGRKISEPTPAPTSAMVWILQADCSMLSSHHRWPPKKQERGWRSKDAGGRGFPTASVFNFRQVGIFKPGRVWWGPKRMKR